MSTFIQEERLAGVVERVTFHSLETGWAVLKVAPFDNPHNLTTVLIHQAKVFAGASIEFYGSWTHHPKYGDQFRANRVLEKKPATAAALEKYLGSGLIKGVGPKTAQAIVKHFKDRTLEVFEEKIEELLKVPNIADKKLQQIRSSWEEHKSIRDVMIFLQSYGISTLYAVKIFKQYGNKAIQIVSVNPYRLARDIYGIGFFSADRIALAMGFSSEGVERIQAGIKHVLASSRDDGHCYLTHEQILNNTMVLLELGSDTSVSIILEELLVHNEIKKRRITTDEQNDLDCYYSNTLYKDETYIATRIREFSHLKCAIDRHRTTTWIAKYCNKHSINLSEEQKTCVFEIVQKPFSILTGGPGCGKTTTTHILVKLLHAMHKSVTLAAPTGRAAQRMSEVIGNEAKTIHRILEWEPHKGGFRKNEEEPLKTNFLIVDECSMLDVNLAAALLKAVPKNCQVLFIGDPDQLPSVGAGNVLQDLLSSYKIVPHFSLTKVFRQAEQSLIIKYAHEINKNNVPNIPSPLAYPRLWKESADCLFIDSDEATQEQLKFIARAKHAISNVREENMSYYLKTGNDLTGEMVKVAEDIQVNEYYQPIIDEERPANSLVLNIPEKFKHVDLESLAATVTDLDELHEILKNVHPWSSLHYGYTALDTIQRLYTHTIPKKLGSTTEIQILTPQVRGSLGTLNLNRMIQETINPAQPNKIQIKMGERFFRVDDRVIQTRNNYDLEVFNGDIGKIHFINPEDYSCLVNFGAQKKSVKYQKEDLSDLSLAYAITIHKSQGSEFESVIIPITTQHYKMLFQNLIYTGLTRAKKLAVFVGTRKALVMAVKNTDNRKRQTALDYLLS